jgi:hypothetical protein
VDNPTPAVAITPDEDTLLSNFRVLPPKDKEWIQALTLSCAVQQLVGPPPRKDVIVGHDPVTGNVALLCIPSISAAKGSK